MIYRRAAPYCCLISDRLIKPKEVGKGYIRSLLLSEGLRKNRKKASAHWLAPFNLSTAQKVGQCVFLEFLRVQRCGKQTDKPDTVKRHTMLAKW